MSAIAPLRPLPADLDRARHAERLEAELEHVGNVLADPGWLDGSGVRLSDLTFPEPMAICRALITLGPDGLIDPGEWDIPAVAAAIAADDRLLGAMALAESAQGPQPIRARLDEIRTDCGARGRIHELARQIRVWAREDRLRLLHRRGAAGEDVTEELVLVRSEIDEIHSGGGAPRVESSVERWRRALIRGGDADPLTRPRHIVRNLVGGSNVGQLIGPSGVMKTQLALELAAVIAEGSDFVGHSVKAGRCLHVFAEGSGGAPRRLAAVYRRHPALDPGDLIALTVPVILGRPGEAETFAGFLVEMLVRGHEKPLRMITIDTQSQSLEGSSDKDEVFAAFERGVRHVVQSVERAQGEPAFGLVITHPGLSDQSRARGTSAQGGNLDFLWVVEPRSADFKKLPLGERIFDVVVMKAKDFEDGWSFTYRAGLEDLGTDSEGFAVRAPAVEILTEDEAIAERASVAASGIKVPKSARHLIELLLRIQARDGRSVIPREVLAASGYLAAVADRGWDPQVVVYGIRVDALQAAIYAEDPDVRTGEDGKRTVSEAARKRWERRRDALINSSAAWSWDGWIWLGEDSARMVPDGG